MKTIRYITVFCLAMSVLTSCSNKQEKISIDLLLAGPMQGNKLNDDCKALLLPFEGMESSIFLPQGNIINATDSVSYIKPQTWVDNLRGNMTKNTSFLMLNEKISKHLAALDLAPLANKAALPDTYIDDVIKKYITIGFNPKIKSDKSFMGYPFKCFSSVEAIRAYIKDSLLSADTNPKILIVYGFPLTEEIKIIAPVAANAPLHTSAQVKRKKPLPGPAPGYEIRSENYSLEDYFAAIADANIPDIQKDRLKNGILKYFTSDAAEVILQMGDLDAGTYHTIKTYLQNLSNTSRKITINTTEKHGEKISKIYVTEH